MIHVCVPVLKRYDLLRNMLASLEQSAAEPGAIYVIDNGLDQIAVDEAVNGFSFPVIVQRPDRQLGLAEAWNWFIQNVPAERLICNDDLIFAPQSLAALEAKQGDFVSALPGSNACSCFLLRDSCVEKVGLFDEEISPGYAYFEDCDYVERMIEKGIPITGCNEAGVVHLGSQTIAMNSPAEWQRHHDRFALAQNNFVKKYGRLPHVPGPHWPKAEA
jgi:hypothetical protein